MSEGPAVVKAEVGKAPTIPRASGWTHGPRAALSWSGAGPLACPGPGTKGVLRGQEVPDLRHVPERLQAGQNDPGPLRRAFTSALAQGKHACGDGRGFLRFVGVRESYRQPR